MKPRRYKCRQPGCPNHYDEVIGGSGWGAKPGRGKGDCLPCWVAATIRGQAPESDLYHSPASTLGAVANHPQMRVMTEQILARGGWTWGDLEAAYNRSPPPRVM